METKDKTNWDIYSKFMTTSHGTSTFSFNKLHSSKGGFCFPGLRALNGWFWYDRAYLVGCMTWLVEVAVVTVRSFLNTHIFRFGHAFNPLNYKITLLQT